MERAQLTLEYLLYIISHSTRALLLGGGVNLNLYTALGLGLGLFVIYVVIKVLRCERIVL